MKCNISLEEAMARVASSLGDHQKHYPSPNSRKTCLTTKKVSSETELNAFLRLDPLLAELHKEFLGLKYNRKQIEKFNTAKDPLLEIACDAEDSAWCAMQTRYYEVRSNRELMARAQALIWHQEQEFEQEQRAEKERVKIEHIQRNADFFRLLSIQDQEKSRTEMGLLEWIVVLWWFQKQARLSVCFYNKACRV